MLSTTIKMEQKQSLDKYVERDMLIQYKQNATIYW